MQTLKLFLYIIIAGLFFTACEKAPFLPQEEANIAFDLNDLSGGTKSTVNFVAGPTELGNDRNNPYTASNIEAAYLEVDLTIVDLEATHYYVKFTPEDADDMEILDDADLLLLDYPWTSEVIREGDYYHKPVNDEDFPDLYTVIEARTAIPPVDYELIDELYLAENRVSILEQAFARTDNERAFEEIYATSLLCEDDTDIMIILPDDCGGGGPTTTTFINDCGCEIFIEPRKPGGCLRVDDTQLANPGQTENFQGVRRVRVFVKSGWFVVKKTFTDDNGCWKVDRNFSGEITVNFRFKNEDRNKIRSSFYDFIQTTSAVKVSSGTIAGPNFHDTHVDILRRGSFTPTGFPFIDEPAIKKEHEIWAAATVNNAIHEFHDFAAAEGINGLPRLNIVLMEEGTFGFASMLRQIGVNDFLNAVEDGADNSTSLESSELFSQLRLGLTLENILGPVTHPFLKAYIGDVTMGVDFSTSDILKRLSYHELAHVSHFTQVGESYWLDVIEASVADGVDASATSPNAPLLSLVESWPEHVALDMLVQNYPNSSSSDFGTWGDHLEEVRNESTDFVPIGLYNDLIDANIGSLVEFVRDEDDATTTGSEIVQDAVNGYTNSMLFSLLTNQVRSIEDYRIQVRSNPGGNFVGDIDLLFSDY